VEAVDIVLVDSGSTDGTVAIASRYPVRLVEIPPKDFTFGRSLNLGCRAAVADVIVVASAHVYPVYPDWLERLLEPFQDLRIGMTYGKQRGDERTRFSEEQIFHKWFPNTSVAWQDHPFCNNANAAIRKELWRQHPFDENLPALEDIEWATWVMAQDHGLAYVGEAEVVHVHDETPREVFWRYRREAMALRRIHPHTHFRLTDLAWLFLANVVSDAWHARRAGRLGGVATEIVWFRWMQFWGTYRGFSLHGPLTQELRQAFYYPRGRCGGWAATPGPAGPVVLGRAAGGPGPARGEAMAAPRRARRRSRSHHG
jgi:glycosyltransferase involved in cell wall biosynthesis